jgi:hypothetical protein
MVGNVFYVYHFAGLLSRALSGAAGLFTAKFGLRRICVCILTDSGFTAEAYLYRVCAFNFVREFTNDFAEVVY